MKKYINQNLFDFIITNYGSLDGLTDFIERNDIEGYLESNFTDNSTFEIDFGSVISMAITPNNCLPGSKSKL